MDTSWRSMKCTCYPQVLWGGVTIINKTIIHDLRIDKLIITPRDERCQEPDVGHRPFLQKNGKTNSIGKDNKTVYTDKNKASSEVLGDGKSKTTDKKRKYSVKC